MGRYRCEQSAIKYRAAGAYKAMVERSGQITAKKQKANEAEPGVITALVRKAIEAKKPKTRYHGGYMASVLVVFAESYCPTELLMP
jgi:hypothetical protein